MRYLENRATYTFTNQRADQIVDQIVRDFQLKAAPLPNTGYVIPSMMEDGVSLQNMIQKALDLTWKNTGKSFYLYDNYDALTLAPVQKPDKTQKAFVLGEGSLVTGYSYQGNIDTNTYNQIEVIQDVGGGNLRERYVEKDSESVARWGLLQLQEKTDEKQNAAQIKELARKLLELHNRPEQQLALSALDLPGLRAGQMVYVDLPETGCSRCY
jgi:hypothetical protein